MLSDKIAIDAINVRCRFVAPLDALIVFLLRYEKFKKEKKSFNKFVVYCF